MLERRLQVNLQDDFNSNSKSNFNTNERTDGTEKQLAVVDQLTDRNAQARVRQSGPITLGNLLAQADDNHIPVTKAAAVHMAELLERRARRFGQRHEGQHTISEVLSDVETEAASRPHRWPVIRTGERTPIPWMLRLSVLLRDGFACKTCDWANENGEGMELDHMVPWSAGGPDDSDNLRTLCARCNGNRSNWVDDAHEVNIRPTTWWCIDCWGDDKKHFRVRVWRDGTDLSLAPRVGDSDRPFELVFCAHCGYYSTSDLYLVGAMGRELIERATRHVKPLGER